MAGKVIIVGAGIAGLATGSYLQANGFETRIFELHSIAGGLCTGWKRGGYTVEGCIHWLVGSSPKSYLYPTWQEIVDLKQFDFVDHDVYTTYHSADGKQIVFYTDIHKLEAELLQKAPEDAAAIRDFTKTLHLLAGIHLPKLKNTFVANTFQNIRFIVGSFSKFGVLNKYMKMTEKEYAQKFKNPTLRKAIGSLFMPDMAVFFSMFTLAWMHNRETGYPLGGSLKLIAGIESAYRKRGGVIHFNKRVKTILTENGKATGIVTEDGTTEYADYVVSAADGYDTLNNMLGGRFTGPALKKAYDSLALFPSYIQVSLGVRKVFNNLNTANQVVELKEPIRIDDDTLCTAFGLTVHNFDPTLSPAGSTLIRTFIGTYNHAYWTNLRKSNYQAYVSAKKRIGEAIVEEIEKVLGPLADEIEMTDVSTPATVIRYTNNWKGSMEGWLLTPSVGLKPMNNTLKGLGNFYMAGQWVQPGGGLPAGLMTGRKVAMDICRKEGIPFRTPETDGGM